MLFDPIFSQISVIMFGWSANLHFQGNKMSQFLEFFFGILGFRADFFWGKYFFQKNSNSFEKLETKNLPEEFQYLITSEKTILSPHIAGWTKESKVKLAEILLQKICSLA